MRRVLLLLFAAASFVPGVRAQEFKDSELGGTRTISGRCQGEEWSGGSGH